MKHRLTFAGKKFIRMGTLLLGVSLVTFLLMSASPLDPLQTNVGETALGSMSREQVENLRAYWGVDTPAAERYLGWLGNALTGDLGESLLYRQPVLAVVGQRLSGSVLLLLTAWLLSGILGLALGVLSGAFRGRLPDRLIRGYCLVISSTPAFWLAILLLLIFSVWLGWLPVGLSVPAGMEAQAVTALDRLRHAVLPALTLSITGVANIALHTREKLVDVLESDYVLFARARGESWRSIVLRHGLRNVLLPAITLQFASVSEIIGGSVLVEQVFSYPGLGQAAGSPHHHPAVSCDLQSQGLPAGANQFIRFHGDRIAHSGGQDKGAARHSDGWPCLISHNSAKSSQWWTIEVFLHAGVQRFPEERRFTEGVSGARDRRHRSRPPP